MRQVWKKDSYVQKMILRRHEKMCYLIAKDRESHGCIAFKTTHGKHLVELKRKLNRAVGYKGVQLVTISRPTAYGEYAPYQFVDTEQEFEKNVKALRP